MAALYPNEVRTFTNPLSTDYMDLVAHDSQHTFANDEINAIETYLGTGVQGTYSNLRTRVGSVEGTISLIAGTVGTIVTGAGTDWNSCGETWTYAGSDVDTFTVTTPGTLTSKYNAGMKVKLTSGGSTQYYIMTAAPSVASGSSTLTLYGGTAYIIGTGAITNNSYSTGKSPQGFPMDQSHWTVLYTQQSTLAQGSPVQSTYYFGGTNIISIPIGDWTVSWEATLRYSGGVTSDIYTYLSTSGTSTGNPSTYDYISGFYWNTGAVGDNTTFRPHIEFPLTLTTRTPHYLIMKTGQNNLTDISMAGQNMGMTWIRAVSNYL